MTKILTPLDQFTANVPVPEGEDERDDAAGDVEAIAQALTNRTHYLNQRTGKLGANNDWTAGNVFHGATEVHTTLFVDPDSASTPGLLIDRTGGDYQEAIALRAGAGSDDRVRIYSGSNSDTQGALYFVINAQWSGSAWSLVDASKPATAVILRNADVRVVGKPAASAAWTSWQQNTISQFDAAVLSEVFRAQRMYVEGNTTADYARGYRYETTVQRISPIPLQGMFGMVQDNSAGEKIRAGGDGWLPIPVPPYCSFRTVRVRFQQNQTSQWDEWQLMKRTALGAWSTVGAVETHGTSGTTTASLHDSGSPNQIVLDAEQWAYRWRNVSGDPAAANNRIIGAEVEWDDNGPSNRIG